MPKRRITVVPTSPIMRFELNIKRKKSLALTDCTLTAINHIFATVQFSLYE